MAELFTDADDAYFLCPPPPQGGGIKQWCASDVCLSRIFDKPSLNEDVMLRMLSLLLAG